jgi:hypothetical protein
MLMMVEVDIWLGEEDPMVMRFASKYALPLRLKGKLGVEVEIPRRALAVSTVRKLAESRVPDVE